MIVLACILIFLEVEARRISRATTEIFQKIHSKKSHIERSSKEKSTGVHKIIKLPEMSL